MKRPTPCNSELKLLRILWETEGRKSSELVVICEEKFGWKKSTTYTQLRRLCEKGYACNENTIVRALVTQEAVLRNESAQIIERTFSGSLPSFLTAFFDARDRLTEEEAEELRRIIDNYTE